MARDRKCIVDNCLYEYCPSCGKGDPSETWRFSFCSENCRDIFNICSEYAFNRMSGEDAKEALSKLDLSNLKNFQLPLQKNISDILATSTPVETVAEEVTETAPEEETVSRRRNKKKYIVNDIDIEE